MFPAEGRTKASSNGKQTNERVVGSRRHYRRTGSTELVRAWHLYSHSTSLLRLAAHLLKAGVSLKLIQKYLGHKHLTSTMIYHHVTTVGEEGYR
ncbi:MAG: tyrosine-type recombinase/integrase [Pirellulales bacterium]